MATPPAEREPTPASNDDVAAREPLLLLPPTSPDSTTTTTTTTGEEVEAAAGEGVTRGSCSPETDDPPACDSSRNSSPAREAVPPGKSVVERGFSSRGVAESCPPDTALRSASPPPPPLSPGSPPCGGGPPGGSPETVVEGSIPPRREKAIVRNGSVLLSVDTRSPPEGDRGTKKCTHSERREGAREGEAAVQGPPLGGGPEGGAQKKGVAASRSGSQPRKVAKNSQENGDPSSSAAAKARGNGASDYIAPEKTERNRRATSVDTKPGGAAGGMPTWVVKPAANTNCGFGIQVCCSLKVIDCSHPFAVESGTLSRPNRSRHPPLPHRPQSGFCHPFRIRLRHRMCKISVLVAVSTMFVLR